MISTVERNNTVDEKNPAQLMLPETLFLYPKWCTIFPINLI